MKKRFSFLAALLMLMTLAANAQLIDDKTNGKVTLGGDVFTDINTGKGYENFKLRAINTGGDFYLTYNFKMGESKHTVSLGLGMTFHNYQLKNSYLSGAGAYADTTFFTEKSDLKNSKLNINYFDIPLEINFRIADKFKISVGFKFGIMMYAKSKYKGEIDDDGIMQKVKYGKIKNIEQYAYTVTLRLAYRGINIFTQYQFNNSYKKGLGPEVIPFSIGLGFRAF